VLSAFDGRQTVAQVYEAMSRSSAIPKGFGEVDFVELICLLIERGFLMQMDDGQRQRQRAQLSVA
jgi:hypothetical protein